MEQKRRPLKKKKKSPLIQFLPYIIIVIIAAALIVAVIVITDKKDEQRGNGVQETQANQTQEDADGSGQEVSKPEGSMQVLSVAEEQESAGEENGETQETAELDTNQRILGLIQTYFQAEEDGDAETLNQIVDTPNPVTEEHLNMINEIIVDYQNIVCYVIDGLDDSSWVTYISYDIQFLNVEQTAPSLDRFIIRQKEDGTMYIDMRPMDEEMNTYLEEVRSRSDVRQLYTDVNNRYIQACNASEELSNLVEMLNKGSLEMYEQNTAGETAEAGDPAEDEGETASDSEEDDGETSEE